MRSAPAAPRQRPARKRRARSINLLPFIVGGAGVAAVGVGTAVRAHAASTMNRATTNRALDCSATRCTKVLENAKARERQAALGTVGVGLGVAALSVAGYLFLQDRTGKEKRPRRMLKAIPVFGQGGGSFRVEALF